MELRCAVQQYAWGKQGRQSEAALLNSSGDPDFLIDDDMYYAELWMGTHSNGPSVLKGSSQKLSEWIKAHPESLGEFVIQKFGINLPFLFKVLSVNQALSIQAHPDKKHAEQLHMENPDVYKDPNHKPELAIALTPFEALCGFRPIEEIKHFLEAPDIFLSTLFSNTHNLCSSLKVAVDKLNTRVLAVVPELRAVVGSHSVNELLMSDEAGMQDALKNCFHSLMTCSKEEIETQLRALLTRLASLGRFLWVEVHSFVCAADESSLADQDTTLLQSLYQTYPGDVGCFCIYFLNHLTLQPGEALYLAPNEPHAYLKGDCVECMACSDNVVRAGLTPKPKDVSTLCNMLTYICESASAKRFPGIRENAYTHIFRPPVPDFAVARINVPNSVEDYLLKPRDSASIVLMVNGHAKTSNDLHLRRGSVVFLPAHQPLQLYAAERTGPLLIFQAMCNTACV
ncbi:hypothetical protein ANN_05679 [Periplaneta americana]|uniref:Mannose-6-phosphate isomerase n=1 Tax=Periplaneta americana TaxID=6978 RepID=A0ABQ8TBG3_PERAM|nr:hypothetical protein ANN_05679 [Periplaneta americana]